MNQEAIFSLMEFILSDHNWVQHCTQTYYGIELDFGIDWKDNERGMACHEINLNLSFRNYENYKDIQNNYFEGICKRFTKALWHTPLFQEQFDEYCQEQKTNIINSMTHEDLEYVKLLLTDKDLCQILFSMPHRRFIELYNKFEETKGSTRELIKKEEK